MRRLVLVAALALPALVACATARDEATTASAEVISADQARVDVMFREPGHCTPVGAWIPKPLFAGALRDRACAFVWSGEEPADRALLDTTITNGGGIAHDNPTGAAPDTTHAFPSFGGIDGGMTPTHGCDVCVVDDGAITWLDGEEVYGFLPQAANIAVLHVPRSDGKSVELVVDQLAAGPFVVQLPPAPVGLSWAAGPVPLRD